MTRQKSRGGIPGPEVAAYYRRRAESGARQTGNLDIAPVIAAEAAALVHDIPSAQEIVRRTVAEAEHLLARRQPVDFTAAICRGLITGPALFHRPYQAILAGAKA